MSADLATGLDNLSQVRGELLRQVRDGRRLACCGYATDMARTEAQVVQQRRHRSVRRRRAQQSQHGKREANTNRHGVHVAKCRGKVCGGRVRSSGRERGF